MSLTQTPNRTIFVDAMGDSLDLSVYVISQHADSQWCPGITTHLIPTEHVTPGMEVTLFDQTWVIRQVVYTDPEHIVCSLHPVEGGGEDWTWHLHPGGMAEVDAPRKMR